MTIGLQIHRDSKFLALAEVSNGQILAMTVAIMPFSTCSTHPSAKNL
jgi:hypothetical protein